jgi:hypothetical protein
MGCGLAVRLKIYVGRLGDNMGKNCLQRVAVWILAFVFLGSGAADATPTSINVIAEMTIHVTPIPHPKATSDFTVQGTFIDGTFLVENGLVSAGDDLVYEGGESRVLGVRVSAAQGPSTTETLNGESFFDVYFEVDVDIGRVPGSPSGMRTLTTSESIRMKFEGSPMSLVAVGQNEVQLLHSTGDQAGYLRLTSADEGPSEAVPEPGTAALLISGLVGAAVLGRGRGRKTGRSSNGW